MDILQELNSYIDNFNSNYSFYFDIDSIRVEFSKQHKLSKLKKIGKWKKLQKNSNILHKLKKRLSDSEITTAYRLENYNIYFYNLQDAPKYRKAIMVIFGLKQYNSPKPPIDIIKSILSILKDVSNIDICFDTRFKPDIKKLSKYYSIKQYITKQGVKTETFYINKPDILGIEKITIYNKSYKNILKYSLWRFEAKIVIHNIKDLYMPLYELKELIDLSLK